MAAMQILEKVRNCVAHHPRENPVRHFQDGDVPAGRAGDGGNFKADIASADNDNTPIHLQDIAQFVGVFQRS